MSDATAQQMPQYRCHKEVSALKIAKIEPLTSQPEGDKLMGPATITPVEDGFAPFDVDSVWVETRFQAGDDNDPDDLGYYVMYADGYASWSPTKAFEEGYRLIMIP